MDFITVLGLAAGGVVTAAYLPQLAKSWQTKKTDDLSFWMCMLLVTGFLLWLTYGVIREDVPLIVSNVLGLGEVAFILYLKVKYK